MSRISQQQLESYLWGAAVLLRGTIDAGDYKQFIFPLLFYKRLCDVHDEETRAALAESGGDAEYAAFPENHRFQVPADAHWREVRTVARGVGVAIQRGMRAIEAANREKLFGIFGDAQWTNKDRLPDAMLRDLVEHFSGLELSVANLPEDELGQGYEYLIKKFADDSGHTAAEFYTNRTVVHLMTELLQPQPGESIYDPTCGSGGMLLSAVTHLRRQGNEWRNVRLYGQERNLMTSSIARMNCFLHGIEDFQIVRGDTLSEPKLVEGDRLMRFDVCLANPPYSIKQWDRAAFASDPWGRNHFGTPPQGRADYAFWQHILASLNPGSGRCAILFPHGVLFRQEEAEMRRRLIEADLVECVIGLGPNLFYNSPMEACIVVCRATKPAERRGKVLFVNAVDEVTRERGQSFLTDGHIARIIAAYETFADEPGLSRAVEIDEIRSKNGSLNIPLYVGVNSIENVAPPDGASVEAALAEWRASATQVRDALRVMVGEDLDIEVSPLAGAVTKWPPSWLNRSQWQRLPFGAFAENINVRVEPADAAEEVYVGLEHLDPGDLRISRWGKGSDVTGTKLRFQRGDVIFGRRRAYQRKLAVAQVDGICSAHAIVVRAKPTKILPEFLPFLMMSDGFMNRAVEISVGSLSPTVNWSALKLEEFDIPPIEQQWRIAGVLWAADAVGDTVVEAELACRIQRETAVRKIFDNLSTESGEDTVSDIDSDECIQWLTIDDILAGKGALTYGILQPGADDPTGVPMLRAIDLENGKLKGTAVLRVSRDIEANYARTRLTGGEVLLSVMGTIGRTALVPPEWSGWNVNRALAVVRVSDRVLPGYFYEWLRSPQMQLKLAEDSIGTAQLRINLSTFRQYRLPVPKQDRQAAILQQLRAMEARLSMFSGHVDACRLLRSTLLNTFF